MKKFEIKCSIVSLYQMNELKSLKIISHIKVFSAMLLNTASKSIQCQTIGHHVRSDETFDIELELIKGQNSIAA